MNQPITGMLHHVEVWVPDLDRAITSWGWLLESLGYTMFQDWPAGRSWRLAATYIVLERSPDLSAGEHDRCRPGLNHLAFHVTDSDMVDALVTQAPHHGWTLLSLNATRTPAARTTTPRTSKTPTDSRLSSSP